MRTFLFIILVFHLNLAFSQNWCEAGANWKYSYVSFGVEGYTEINYVSDTMLAGQNAKKLEKSFNTYNYFLGQGQSGSMGYEYTYEDSGVVYVLYENNWDTLYNFNANVGDSWRMAKQPLSGAVCDSNSLLTVSATGTKVVNSISLKYIVVDFGTSFIQTDTLLEKIGFLDSYMFPYDDCDAALDGNQGGPLRCYEDNNFALYQPHYNGACDFVVGMDEETSNDFFTIFPNPAGNKIEIIGNTSSNIIEIKDVQGKIWLNSFNSDVIDIGFLPNGLYILSLFDNTGVHHKRFVKQ